jgi:hypothetical protein
VQNNEIVTQILAYKLKHPGTSNKENRFKEFLNAIVVWLNKQGLFKGTVPNFNLDALAYCLKLENVKI